MKKSKKLQLTMTPAETVWGWRYLLFALALLPMLLFQINSRLPSPLDTPWVNFFYHLINFLVVIGLFRKFLLESVRQAGRQLLPCLRGALLGFAAYWVLSFAVDYAITALVPGFYNVNDSTVTAMAGKQYWLTAIGAVVLVPVAEETFFRGLIFRGLYSRSKAGAYAISTAAFCAAHILSYAGIYSSLTLLLCFVQYIPAGLCLAWAYVHADCIFAPILIHTMVNAIAIYAMR